VRNVFEPPVARSGLWRALLSLTALLVAVTVMACETPTGTARPSPSLVDLDFTPLPTLAPAETAGASESPTPIAGVWPVGWDVAFCTGLTDTVVTHELVIDIQRALDDDVRDDAIALTAELADTLPIATAAVARIRDWEPATQSKAGLTAMLELHAAAATAYQSWFDEGGRRLGRAARQARQEVARAVPATNESLAELAELGLTCPGTNLALEEF
jgi:hypothetical protein